MRGWAIIQFGVLVIIISQLTASSIAFPPYNLAAESQNCVIECYSPDLDINVGDTFTWFANNLTLYFGGTLSLQDPKEVQSITLNIIKPLNGISRTTISSSESEYMRIDSVVFNKENSNFEDEQLSLLRLPARLISPGTILFEDLLVNYFDYQSLYQEQESYMSNINGKPRIVTIQRYIVENSFFLVKNSNSTTDDDPWYRREITEIEIDTGLLLSYLYQEGEDGGNLTEDIQINTEPFSFDQIRKTLELPNYFIFLIGLLGTFMIGFTVIYFTILRPKR